jgi:peptidoglycan/LPS O-acetylase OafA/YrhL
MLAAPAEGIGHVGVTSQSFALGCVRTILSFAIGILIHRHQHRLVALPALPTWVLLILVAAGLAFPWGGRSYDMVFVLLLSPSLVAFGVATVPTGRSATLAAWLGLISFPLYAIHRPILQVVEALAARLPIAPAMIGWAAIVGLLVLAGLAHGLDTAVRRRLTHWFRPPLRRDPGSAAAP